MAKTLMAGWQPPLLARPGALTINDRRLLQRLSKGPLVAQDIEIGQCVHAGELMRTLVASGWSRRRFGRHGMVFWSITPAGIAALAADRAAEAAWAADPENRRRRRGYTGQTIARAPRARPARG